MKVIVPPVSTVDRLVGRSNPRFLAIVIGCLLTVITLAEDAKAQFYRAYRPGGVIVAPPFFAGPYGSPYFASPYFAPPVIAAPPSSVRIRTPFFSMNIDPGGYIPPRASVYGYQYETYRPSYGYSSNSRRLDMSSPEYGADPRYGADYRPEAQYSAGAGGGIPELTPPVGGNSVSPAPAPVSLATLQFSAETLRRALASRRDGDVWLDYLQLESIIAAADAGWPTAELSNLKTRFDGVTMNPGLTAISRLPGFVQTHRLLAAWLESEDAVSDYPDENQPVGPAERANDRNVPQRSPENSAIQAPDQTDDQADGPGNEELPAPAPVPAPAPDSLDPFSPT